MYTYNHFWQGIVLNPSFRWLPSLALNFRLGFIANKSINTMKYIKIVFFCLSEKKEKGKSFSPAGDLHEITSKTLLLKVGNEEPDPTNQLNQTGF